VSYWVFQTVTYQKLRITKKQPSLELLQCYSKVLGIKLSSLILLSENFEEASRNNRSQEFIKSMMLRLINFMSKNEGVLDEPVEKEKV